MRLEQKRGGHRKDKGSRGDGGRVEGNEVELMMEMMENYRGRIPGVGEQPADGGGR